MKGIVALLLITLAAGGSANAAPVVLDLSRSHSFEDLMRSGLSIKEIAGGLHGQAYSIQSQEVEIRLPAGRSITQTMVLGTIDTQNGELRQLSMYGEVMPLEQAVQIAHLFHQSYDLPTAAMTAWKDANRNGIRSVNGYSVSPVLQYYPIISLAIDGSINQLYPWVVRFEIDWGWKEQREWNEERAWRELPRPAIAAISLDPPGGLRYDPRDAYKESLEAQAKFEKELAAKGATSTPTATQSTSIKAKPEFPLVIQPEHPLSFPRSWIVGAILLLAVAGGTLFKFLRK
jgi:hypothetical protein